MKQRSKDYIDGFKHGVKWMRLYSGIKMHDPDYDEDEYEEAIKETVKSLKAGR